MAKDTKDKDTQGDLPEGAVQHDDVVGVDLPEDWKISDGDESLNLYQRMVIARQHMQYIKKTRQGTLKFATVNHDEVTVHARAALDKANVLAIPNVLMHDKTGNTTICEVEVEFVNPDKPEERYSVTMFAESNDNQDKGPGGAISYGIKFCLLKALMGETGEKDADEQDVNSGPTEADKEQAERDEWMEAITDSVKHHELDKVYVWAEMKRRAKGNEPTLEELGHQGKSIAEHPEQWRSEQQGGE